MVDSVIRIIDSYQAASALHARRRNEAFQAQGKMGGGV
jgi:hypothetical protein